MNLFVSSVLAAVSGTGAAGAVDPALTALITTLIASAVAVAQGVQKYRRTKSGR